MGGTPLGGIMLLYGNLKRKGSAHRLQNMWGEVKTRRNWVWAPKISNKSRANNSEAKIKLRADRRNFASLISFSSIMVGLVFKSFHDTNVSTKIYCMCMCARWVL